MTPPQTPVGDDGPGEDAEAGAGVQEKQPPPMRLANVSGTAPDDEYEPL